jgi:hypothetical protein
MELSANNMIYFEDNLSESARFEAKQALQTVWDNLSGICRMALSLSVFSQYDGGLEKNGVDANPGNWDQVGRL